MGNFILKVIFIDGWNIRRKYFSFGEPLSNCICKSVESLEEIFVPSDFSVTCIGNF